MTIRWSAASCAVILLVACAGKDPANGSGNTAGISAAGGAGFGSGSGNAGAGFVNVDGSGESCTVEGEVRACCDNSGTQVCQGSVEFKLFGPCLDGTGKQITCAVPYDPGKCGEGEFAKFCGPATDAGSSSVCGDGEFGPMCEGDGGVPPMPKLCKDRSVNNEPEILMGYAPAFGETVSQNGQIKVWINDECPLLVAPDEQIDPASGLVTKAGDRAAVAEDNYLLEPALYIAPASADSGGTPHFPQYIKGWHNNVRPPFTPYRCRNDSNLKAVQVPGMDPMPAGAMASEMYDSEVIWDVKTLGLKPGTYMAQFLIHDGDHDRGIGCINITITP